ncbi:NADAR family protein [Dysosmobacter sp.]|uniref:NADAR family protein n=1 Tax=Dysosmobacter sp. TaxID=2591382 RepID=UPI003AB4A651
MMAVICFHNPDEENGYLSNWYPSPFTLDGVAFSSMEQYMMYRKAVCFGDDKVAAQILVTEDVAEIKTLGRLVSGYDESLWNGVRQIVVYEGLLAKFSQNSELGGQLKKTGNTVLAECAVKDRIWGIGLSMHDSDRLDRAKWQGQNLLGYALMMVREKLRTA